MHTKGNFTSQAAEGELFENLVLENQQLFQLYDTCDRMFFTRKTREFWYRSSYIYDDYMMNMMIIKWLFTKCSCAYEYEGVSAVAPLAPARPGAAAAVPEHRRKADTTVGTGGAARRVPALSPPTTADWPTQVNMIQTNKIWRRPIFGRFCGCSSPHASCKHQLLWICQKKVCPTEKNALL